MSKGNEESSERKIRGRNPSKEGPKETHTNSFDASTKPEARHRPQRRCVQPDQKRTRIEKNEANEE